MEQRHARELLLNEAFNAALMIDQINSKLQSWQQLLEVCLSTLLFTYNHREILSKSQ